MKQQTHGGDIYRHKGVLDFSSNMNPLGVPEGVRRALEESLHSIRNYPDTECEELKAALAEHEQIPKEWIICGNGAAELIYTIVQAKRPHKALLQSPTFSEYGNALQSVGCSISYYESKRKDAFQIQEDFLEYIGDDIDMIFLCNPNNPTGILIDPGLLRRICEKCRERGVQLVMDECFLDFLAEQAEYTMKMELELNPDVFVLKAFTKLYAMAGLRLGYGMSSNQRLLELMSRMIQPWNVSVPAQAAGVAALQEEMYVETSRELVRGENARVKRCMRELGYACMDSKVNYIFFEGPENLYEKCLEKGILIRDCSNYRGMRKGDYRIAIRRPEENDRLLRVLKESMRGEIWQNQL